MMRCPRCHVATRGTQRATWTADSSRSLNHAVATNVTHGDRAPAAHRAVIAGPTLTAARARAQARSDEPLARRRTPRKASTPARLGHDDNWGNSPAGKWVTEEKKSGRRASKSPPSSRSKSPAPAPARKATASKKKASAKGGAVNVESFYGCAIAVAGDVIAEVGISGRNYDAMRFFAFCLWGARSAAPVRAPSPRSGPSPRRRRSHPALRPRPVQHPDQVPDVPLEAELQQEQDGRLRAQGRVQSGAHLAAHRGPLHRLLHHHPRRRARPRRHHQQGADARSQPPLAAASPHTREPNPRRPRRSWPRASCRCGRRARPTGSSPTRSCSRW